MTAGRPKIEFGDKEWNQLETLCKIQCTAEECASVLGVSTDTLDRRLKEAGFDNFAEFYKKNADAGKASLRRLQWKAAEAGNPTMLIWLGKQVLDQKDRTHQEVTGKDGGPILASWEVLPVAGNQTPSKDT